MMNHSKLNYFKSVDLRLMTPPAPLLFKNRLIIFVISFLLFCFFVGAVKSAFADSNFKFEIIGENTGYGWTQYGSATFTVNMCDGSVSSSHTTGTGANQNYTHYGMKRTYLPTNSTAVIAQQPWITQGANLVIVDDGCECPGNVEYDPSTGKCEVPYGPEPEKQFGPPPTCPT